MSSASVERLYARFSSQVDQACAEGRGEELFLAYHRDVGADVAEVLFLAVNSTSDLSARGPEAEAAERNCDLIERMSTDMIAAIRKSFTSSGYLLGTISERCEEAARQGLADRFNALLAASRLGGSA